MISGYSPFRGRTYEKIMEENKNAFILFDRPVWKSISEECMELIRKMTSVDSKNRISFEQILEHPVNYYHHNISGFKNKLKIYQPLDQSLNRLKSIPIFSNPLILKLMELPSPSIKILQLNQKLKRNR
jgi:serine/threonine protein kinase